MTTPNSKSSRQQIKITSVYHTCHISIQGSDSSQLPPQLNTIFSFSQQKKLMGCLRYDSSDIFQMFMGKWIMWKYLRGHDESCQKSASLHFILWELMVTSSSIHSIIPIIISFAISHVHLISVTNLLITSILLSWKSCIWIAVEENWIKLCLF